MQELLARAQQLVAAGPYDARPAEIAAVHDGIWPEKAPVCPTLTCRQVLGVAYFSIKRWAEQQGVASDAPLSSTPMKKNTSVARFKSDHTIYTPHGLGVAYSNTNLTDKAARYILENDPDAKALFSELPGEPSEEEQKASQASAPAPAPAPAAAGEIDYVKLAQAIVDIQNKNKAAEPDAEVKDLTQEAKENAQPLTASAGGAAEVSNQPNGAGNQGDDADNDGRPVRLSRMNKEQLVATYTTELGQAPDEKLTNEDLRDAIAEKRASQQDPE